MVMSKVPRVACLPVPNLQHWRTRAASGIRLGSTRGHGVFPAKAGIQPLGVVVACPTIDCSLPYTQKIPGSFQSLPITLCTMITPGPSLIKITWLTGGVTTIVD